MSFVRKNGKIELFMENTKDLAVKEDSPVKLKEHIHDLRHIITDLLNKSALNSDNSSKPPSSDDPNKDKSEGKKKSNNPIGGQEGHEGTTLKRTENPDVIKDHYPDGTCQCGCSLVGLESQRYTSRQVIDIIIKTETTEHRSHEVTCSCCGKAYQGAFPDGVNNHVQYSNGVKAIVSYLSKYQEIPFERLEEALKDIFGIDISQGTLCNTNETLFNKLAIFEEKLKAILKKASLLHADESWINVLGKKLYLHVLSNENYTFLYPHAKRGRVAIDEMGVLIEYLGILVTDFYSSYLSLVLIIHAFCCAHLVRELDYSEDRDRQFWAKKMRQLLLYANYLKTKGQFSEAKIAAIERSYSDIIEKGLIECPPPDNPKGEKRVKKSKSRNLLERFDKHRKGILLFIHDPKVPFTNNLAERDLRPSKVHQKISGCFRSLKGAKIAARIRSYISTLKKQSINVMDGLKDIFSEQNVIMNQLVSD